MAWGTAACGEDATTSPIDGAEPSGGGGDGGSAESAGGGAPESGGSDSAGGGGSEGVGGSGGADPSALCGGNSDKLWAWTWAGETGQHATVYDKPGTGLRITQLEDLSGNGNHFHNLTGTDEPGYQVGYSYQSYSTALPAIALNKYDGGKQLYVQFLLQDEALDASGGFYLAFAGMNTRDSGQREMWGTTTTDNVRLDQERDRVNATIGGVGLQLTADAAVPKGPLLLEVFRTDQGELHVSANGVDVGLAITNDEVFQLSGTGFDGTGSSGWDDVAFEYVMCKGLPTQEQRDHVRSELNQRWGIY